MAQISPHDSTFTHWSEKLKQALAATNFNHEPRINDEEKRLKNLVENVYMDLVNTYYRLFSLYRNRVVRSVSLRSGRVHEAKVNFYLCLVLNSIMRLFEVFGDFLNRHLAHIIRFIVFYQSKLEFDELEDREYFLKQMMPIYEGFVLSYGTSYDMVRFKANLNLKVKELK